MSNNAINIVGIPTTRVSDLFIQQQMLSQLEAEQVQMARTEEQLSTGTSSTRPSSNPIAAHAGHQPAKPDQPQHAGADQPHLRRRRISARRARPCRALRA